jgi:hypothetical protein
MVEEHVWSVVAEALANPDAIVALAAEQANVAAVTEGLSTDDLLSLDRKISRLEKAASTALAEALSQGIDMAVAAGAVRALQAELGEARRRRDQLAAWAASAAESAGRAKTIEDIASDTTDALALRPFGEPHRRVLDVLDIAVAITGWRDCASCSGSGRATGAGRGRVCDKCLGHGSFPVLRIDGHVPHIAAADTPWPVTLARQSIA